jgi:hypothetical protein
VFPPPHQYLYPLDFADNLKFVWYGRGFGVRQPPEGDKRFVPWVNALPRSEQHLSLFYCLSRGQTPRVLEEVRRFTHGDRFKKLDGYRTFTSHYHIEHTQDFLNQQKQQRTDNVPKGLRDGFTQCYVGWRWQCEVRRGYGYFLRRVGK